MSQDHQTPSTPTSESRRRLVQGGLSGAPLLLLLKSTPALATYSCKQPSGFSVSGNLSQPGSQTCHQYYKKPSDWYYTCQSSSAPSWKNYKVKDVLGSCGYNSAHNDKKLKDALADGDEFLRYCVAAWANAAGGSGYPVNTATVCDMWKKGAMGSYQAVTYPVVNWGKTDVVAYFKYTMGES
ncbi:hypothetical protein [Denitromonas iodatirespirans]|uniref:Uncharacterized protein n=1 Tax=Denitromonas iodatirespirans TaxID=2795389 RepID=A0A944DBV5_DENI1|nr:hypothetical protein [Denitromonas iodatirespirans]MBT0963930.1 hypothetical protein [Denitromonas iodatirespirans]